MQFFLNTNDFSVLQLAWKVHSVFVLVVCKMLAEYKVSTNNK